MFCSQIYGNSRHNQGTQKDINRKITTISVMSPRNSRDWFAPMKTLFQWWELSDHMVDHAQLCQNIRVRQTTPCKTSTSKSCSAITSSLGPSKVHGSTRRALEVLRNESKERELENMCKNSTHLDRPLMSSSMPASLESNASFSAENPRSSTLIACILFSRFV